MGAEEQVAVLFAGVNGYLDKIQTSEIGRFQEIFLEHLKSKHHDLMDEIATKRQLSKQNEADLHSILKDFIPSAGLKMKS